MARVVVQLWRQKWVIVATALVTLAGTAAWSRYFLPVRYHAETSILVTPTIIRGDIPEISRATPARLQSISQQILSRTRLENIIEEFHLYEEDLGRRPIQEIVDQMRRRDVTVTFKSVEDRSGGVAGFSVGFVSHDPGTAMKVAERLANTFVQMNLLDSERLSDANRQFIRSQIEDLRRRVSESERLIAGQRANRGRAAQADLIEYEVRQETLRSLLVKEQEALFVLNMERRQIGEQFRVIDAARLPTRPVSPDPVLVNTAGGAGGLILGLLLAAVVSARQQSRTQRADTAAF